MALEVMAQAHAPIPLDVSFRVEPGALLALVGHSGSGKTTLLRTIAGLWKPKTARVVVDGTVWLDTVRGTDVATHHRCVGVVFQNYALFPHMTALQNIMAGMPHDRKSQRQEAERLLALVHLGELANRMPAELSGGQKQRVALARAIARQPKVLLLDEPFSAVDRATREKLHAELLSLRQYLTMPVVLVTHDMNEAQMLADRIVVIERGETVRAGSTADVMADPAALRAMGLRELAAMLPARLEEHESDGLSRLQTAVGPIWLPHIDGPPGMSVRVRILAHEVILADVRPERLSAQNILPATVTQVVPGEGPGVIVHLAIGEAEILARLTRRSAANLALAPGANVYAILKSMSVARDHVAPMPAGRG